MATPSINTVLGERVDGIEDATGELTELSDLDTIVPTLVSADGSLSVTPVYTEKLTATTQNDNRVHKTLCGDTYVEGIGEEEWRVTLEALVVKPQLQTLFQMRPAGNKLTVIGEARTHENVTFDRFTYEQTDDLNKGRFSYEGRIVKSSLFSVQLQTQGDTQ